MTVKGNGNSGAPRWRMPAEWERHAATWIAWPRVAANRPAGPATVPHVYAQMVHKIAGCPGTGQGEAVHVMANDARHEDRAWMLLLKYGVEERRVRFFRWPTDRGWTRDIGPIWVKGIDAPHGARPSILQFRFNGRAKYRSHLLDGAIAERAARELGVESIDAQSAGRPVVLEGGAFDVNGAGSLLATEQCLLDEKVQVRNPGFTRRDYETVFSEYLGATRTIWLGRGLAGDDAHGHVDDLARFVNEKTIVLAEERDAGDPNQAILEENRERLEGARLADGSRPAVVRLPMPSPLVYDGQRLPASYANFYVANAAVLVPTFNDPNDRLALGILSELFSDRPVVGIHALDLVWGRGTLHCLTQQQPA
jgi:agmatine deiminase